MIKGYESFNITPPPYEYDSSPKELDSEEIPKLTLEECDTNNTPSLDEKHIIQSSEYLQSDLNNYINLYEYYHTPISKSIPPIKRSCCNIL